MMLMSQCLTHALKSWNSVFAASANADPLKLKVYLVLVQILERAIQSQNSDGSWGKHTREETAYAILTINNIIGLPVLSNLTTPLHAILSAGRKVLLEITKETSEPEFLWIEKVTYASSVLSNSYVLAALNCSPPESAMEPPFKIATTELAMQSKFYSKLPLFARSSELNLNIFMLEGLFFSAALRQGCAGIFPRKDMREEKYLKFIPFTWTGGNNLSDQTLNAEVCLDMMVISALIYQADEFMESVVGSQPLARLPQIAAAIDGIFDKVETRNSKFISDRNFKAGVYLNGSTCFDDIIDTLEKFVEFTIYHPHISNASETDRGQLCNDLHEFLLSHLAQVEDNHRLRAQGHPLEASVFRSAKSSFAQWIRSTSANHTGGPFAFSFLLCLLARDGQDFFPTAEGKYIAQDVARHISTMCRMYNDWASIARDRKEQNLNSINFPEFHKGLSATTIEETVLKERLFRLCNYERKCLDLSMAELKKVCSEDKAKQIQVFCDVTDLYGQMYMVKDMTPAVKKRETFDQPAAEWSGKRVKA